MYNLLEAKVVRYLAADAADRAELDAHGWVSTNPIRKALQLLERIVVHDCVYVDLNALRGLLTHEANHDRESAPVLPPFVVPIAISSEQYKRIDGQVRASLSVIRDRDLLIDLNTIDADDQYDIQCHQGLFKQQYAGWPNSTDSLERAMFYLHLASESSNPVFLSPVKDEWVDHYRGIVARRVIDLFREAGHQVDDAVRGTAPYGVVDPGPIPGFPLAAFLLRYANRRGITILEAALELRDWRPAIEFRRHLKQLYETYAQGFQGQLKVEQALGWLRASAEKWRHEADTRLGVSRTEVIFRLKAIPVVGAVFEFFDREQTAIRLPDVLLTNRPMLQFMSSLYMSDSQIDDIRTEHWINDARFGLRQSPPTTPGDQHG